MGYRIAGICYIKADGVNLSIKGKAEYSANPITRENVMSLLGPIGYSEKTNKPMLKIDVVTDVNFPRQQLVAMTNGTITFEAANGHTYNIFEAFLEGEHTIDAVEGSSELTFGGMRQAWS